FRLVLATAIDEIALLDPVLHVLDMADLHRPVEHELGVRTGEPVLLREERHVVPRRETLELRPRLPAGREWTGVTRGLELGHRRDDFWPRLRRAIGIEPRLLERG